MNPTNSGLSTINHQLPLARSSRPVKPKSARNGSQLSSIDHQPSTLGNQLSTNRPLRVALVDDDESAHLSIRKAFEALASRWVLDSYLTPRIALDAIPKSERPPQVVLMDVHMPVLSGIDCTRRLKARLPELAVVMLTGCSDSAIIVESVIAGACGYMIKPVSPERLVWAVGEASQGRMVLCNEAQAVMAGYMQRLSTASSSSGLSRREREIMMCAAQSLSSKEIASRLGISINTVRVHFFNIFDKLGAHNRQEAVRKFFGQGATS